MFQTMSLGCVLLLSVFTVSQWPWGSTGGMGNWGLFPSMTYEYEQPSSYSFAPGGISNVGGVFTFTNPRLTFGALTTVNSTNPQPWGFPSIGGNTGSNTGNDAGYGALNAMAYGMSNAGMGYSPYGGYGASYSPSYTNGGYSPSYTNGGYSRSYTNGGYSPYYTNGASYSSYTNGGYSPSYTNGGYSRSYANGGYYR